MMLRGRNAANADNVAAGAAGQQNNGHPIKRQITRGVTNNDVEKGEPKAKRAALSDVTRAVSNFRIDSTKKSAILQPKKIVNGVRRSFGKRTLSTSEYDQSIKKEIEKKASASPDPCPGFDFDKQNKGDLSSVPDYAFDIFLYYKHREGKFLVNDYTKRHRQVTKEMRAVLLDWMVEVQENFELNHETLYLAVKLVDTYLYNVKEIVRREDLQLVASAAIFIASKYDERHPPLIEDFLYICEDQFARDELCAMERKMFKVVGFDVGMPLSYRFLRRYAKVSQVDMATLTLARFVLETSLMFVDFVMVPESLMAAAAHLLAIRMKKIGDWSPVLKKYSGYKLEDVEPLMWSLNHMMRARPSMYPRLQTVCSKYSHEIFFEVAKIPLLIGGKAASEPVGPPAALKK